MSLNFNRKLSVKLTNDINSETGAIEFKESFKISFNITRVADGTRPDSCEVSIYNVLFDNYEMFRLDPLIKMACVIKGGYGKQQGTLFKGNVTNIEYIREGNDNIMKITCGDGVEALKAKPAKTYNDANADKITLDIIDEMKKAGMAVAKEALDAIKSKLTGKKETGKTVLNDTARKHLDTILKKHKLSFGIVNNELNIVDSIKRKIPDFGVKMSGLNGLIGSPSRLKQQRSDGSTVDMVSFKCLINPDIVSGREVELDSKYISGKFVVQNMTVSGDTWADGEWVMSCEAI